jgi:hypothetical protein
MPRPTLAFLAVSAVALAGTVFAQTNAPSTQGFFRPSPDPAITAFRPLPGDNNRAPQNNAAPQAGNTQPGANTVTTPPTPDAAQEIRRAEEAAMERVEAAMDRVEAAHARAAAVPPRAPTITSPMDGTAPIMSPLDGTAPIVSPIAR